MDNVTWILIGIVVLALIVIFLIKKNKPTDNVTRQVTDEGMQDQLGTRHVNASTASSTNRFNHEEDEESRIMQEGQTAQKRQRDEIHQAKETVRTEPVTEEPVHHEDAVTPSPSVSSRDPHAVEADADHLTGDANVDHSTVDENADHSTVDANADHDLKELNYEELKLANAGQAVSLKGQIASLYREDLEVPGATALGSLSMGDNQVVALKFINPVNDDLQTGDTLTLHGHLDGIKDADQVQVPAITVDSYVKA
ncbi:hypothetical protein ACWOBX_04960 [Facklamia languida]